MIIDHLGSPLMEDLTENAEQNLSFCRFFDVNVLFWSYFFGHVMSCQQSPGGKEGI